MQLAEVVTSLDAYRDRKRELRDSATYSTGSLGLDLALGGGWRKGRIAELFGDYSTHKTSLALHTVARAQKVGRVLWCDPASDFNPVAATKAGVDLKSLILYRPDSAAELLETMQELASATSLMVVDRATGLDVDACLYEDRFGWLKSELITSAALFISDQERHADNAFITALRTWATQRVALYAMGRGQVQPVVVKNQIARPAGHPIRLRFNDGYFDDVYELVYLALFADVIEQRGSWYYLDGIQLGQGIPGTVKALSNGACKCGEGQHDMLVHHLRDLVRERLA
jgi:recombination protein RecA